MKHWRCAIPENHRFWLKVYPRGDCWEWRGARRVGYGAFAFDGRVGMAHRYAYIQAKGPIPTGLQLDHLCRHPWCVRPSHLEAVTGKQNSRRGWGRNHRLMRSGLCCHGHPQNATNVYMRKDRPGHKMCRACVRERIARYKREGRLGSRKTKRAPSNLQSLGTILKERGLV
jgi:hypothetical protein